MATIFLLPGASGHGSFWTPVADRLAGRHLPITVDWPGLGGVGAVPHVQSYQDLVSVVVARLEQRPEPCVIVGQSMGGWVAARAAIERPELVTHLVLAVTAAGVDVEALGATDWRSGARAARPDAPEWSFERHPPMEAELASLTIPTLLLWASDDPISPVAVGRRLDELLPSSELVVYDSDDHWVVLDHVDDVAARIDAFVAR